MIGLYFGRLFQEDILVTLLRLLHFFRLSEVARPTGKTAEPFSFAVKMQNSEIIRLMAAKKNLHHLMWNSLQ
jgi:hypothetical protein